MDLFKYYTISIYLCLISSTILATSVEDSLLYKINTSSNDTNHYSVYTQLVKLHLNNRAYKKALYYNKRCYLLAKTYKNISKINKQLISYGEILYYSGQLKESKSFFLNSKKYIEKTQDAPSLAENYSDLGIIYTQMQRHDSAEYYYKLAIKYDIDGSGYANNNLATHYFDLGQISKAIKSYENGLKIHIQNGDIEKQAFVLSNMANIYIDIKNYSKSIDILKRCISLFEKSNNVAAIFKTYSKLSLIYCRKKEYKEAFYYTNLILKSEHKKKHLFSENILMVYDILAAQYLHLMSEPKEIQDSILHYDNQYSISEKQNTTILINTSLKERCRRTIDKLLNQNNNPTYYSLGLAYKARFYSKIGNIELATKISIKAYNYCDSLNLNGIGKTLPEDIHKYYLKQKKLKQAFHWKKKYVFHVKNNLDKSLLTQIGKFESKFDFLNQTHQDSLKNIEQQSLHKEKILLNETYIQQENRLIYLLIIGFIILAGLSIWLFKNYRLTLHRNSIILNQKDLLVSQKILAKKRNDQITKSTNYAKLIQKGVLSNKENLLIDCAKEIVTGDFYWNFKNENMTIHTIVDTGINGIPGALMTIIGTQILQKIVRYNPTDITFILRLFLSNVKKLANRNDKLFFGNIKIGILLIQNNEATFVGSNQNLYHIRYNELTCYNGKGDHSKTTIKIPIQSNDRFYFITDGFGSFFKELVSQLCIIETNKSVIDKYKVQDYKDDATLIKIMCP